MSARCSGVSVAMVLFAHISLSSGLRILGSAITLFSSRTYFSGLAPFLSPGACRTVLAVKVHYAAQNQHRRDFSRLIYGVIPMKASL
jgi:hypothetical protein